VSLDIAIAGCGDISHMHAEAARRLGGKARFSACCDVDIGRAEKWAATYSAARAYGSLDAMLAGESPHSVLLATWPNQHREQVETCLKAGVRNILCEKALTLTGREAAEMWDMAESAGAFILEGFMYRHHPALRTIERLVEQGAAGEVDAVRASFSNSEQEIADPADATRGWRQRKECAGGVPYDFACYAVNACGHFARAEPVRAAAFGGVSRKYDIVDRLYGVIEYANGRVGVVQSSKKALFDQELVVTGSEGSLVLPIAWTIPGPTAVVRRSCAEWAEVKEESHPIAFADPYALQLDNFADVVAGKARPLIPLVQSVVNTFAIEALVACLLERRSREIEIPAAVLRAYHRHLASPRLS
jgi:predicted dehydrogenase